MRIVVYMVSFGYPTWNRTTALVHALHLTLLHNNLDFKYIY